MNLYDLLDVPESASEAQIRAAWKQAIADLDPTERRFRVFNDAAAVLLDPDKKAAHDAELAAEREASEAEEAEAAAGGDTGAGEETAGDTGADAAGTDADETHPADSAIGEPEDSAGAAKPAPRAEPASAGPPGWAFGAAGLGALLAVVLAIYLLAQPGGHLFGDDSPKEIAQRNADAVRTTLAAEGAAEAMVAPVLSYNHATMDADLERLKGYLTPKMVKKQTAAWPELSAEAAKQQIVVEATATATALTRLSDDGKRATVVVFIDQLVKKAATEPFALHMWATMELVRTGDAWLLDDLCTDASCG